MGSGWATTSGRALAAAVLLTAGCAHMPSDVSELMERDREDAVLATLLYRLGGGSGPYCVRVFGDPPSSCLARRLRAVGIEEINRCDGVRELRITDIQVTPAKTIAVDFMSYGGPTATTGIRFFIRRNWPGRRPPSDHGPHKAGTEIIRCALQPFPLQALKNHVPGTFHCGTNNQVIVSTRLRPA